MKSYVRADSPEEVRLRIESRDFQAIERTHVSRCCYPSSVSAYHRSIGTLSPETSMLFLMTSIQVVRVHRGWLWQLPTILLNGLTPESRYMTRCRGVGAVGHAMTCHICYCLFFVGGCLLGSSFMFGLRWRFLLVQCRGLLNVRVVIPPVT